MLRLFCLLRDDAEKMTEMIMNNKGISFKVGDLVHTDADYWKEVGLSVFGIINEIVDIHRVLVECIALTMNKKESNWTPGEEHTIHVDWLELGERKKAERKKGKEVIPIYQT